uniref:Uncharacterized protein n=1 Tax=Parastrongyloides trichosuri TaxID=131310 RepID=A0A0N4ZIU5_PARTI
MMNAIGRGNEKPLKNKENIIHCRALRERAARNANNKKVVPVVNCGSSGVNCQRTGHTMVKYKSSPQSPMTPSTGILASKTYGQSSPNLRFPSQKDVSLVSKESEEENKVTEYEPFIYYRKKQPKFDNELAPIWKYGGPLSTLLPPAMPEASSSFNAHSGLNICKTTNDGQSFTTADDYFFFTIDERNKYIPIPSKQYYGFGTSPIFNTGSYYSDDDNNSTDAQKSTKTTTTTEENNIIFSNILDTSDDLQFFMEL